MNNNTKEKLIKVAIADMSISLRNKVFTFVESLTDSHMPHKYNSDWTEIEKDFQDLEDNIFEAFERLDDDIFERHTITPKPETDGINTFRNQQLGKDRQWEVDQKVIESLESTPHWPKKSEAFDHLVRDIPQLLRAYDAAIARIDQLNAVICAVGVLAAATKDTKGGESHAVNGVQLDGAE